MPIRVTCHHCGFPFSVRTAPGRPLFCCTGCAIAGRIPVDARGNFPVNGALVYALATGFAYFNQLLFWGLSLLLAGAGETEAVARTVTVSLLAGLVSWVLLTAGLLRAGGGRWCDRLVATAALVLGLAGWRLGAPEGAAAANGLLLVWSIRGLFKQKTRRKPDVTV